MIRPHLWRDNVPLRYTIKTLDDPDSGSLVVNMEWKQFGTRSQIVADQAEYLSGCTPKKGVVYPREHTIALGRLVLDRFVRNADGTWTHHDLFARRSRPVTPSRGLD